MDLLMYLLYRVDLKKINKINYPLGLDLHAFQKLEYKIIINSSWIIIILLTQFSL